MKEEYYSLRFNSSEGISGIPTDEIALDPVLTKKSIEKNEISDASKTTKIPPTFTYKSINQDSCNKNGTFTIIGELSQSITDQIKFTLPLTYPEGITLSCVLNNNEIQCKVDRAIDNKAIIIEQAIIKQGIEELLILGSISSEENLNCENAIYKESVKRKEITISFRQVSHLTTSAYSFSFYLITLMTSASKKGSQINLKLNVNINSVLTEKTAVCSLEKDVSPSNGQQVQGNFECTVSLTSSEYSNTDFQSISVSADNDEISGVSDLNDITSNPYKTDQVISEIKSKKENNEAINELTNVVDYYAEEDNIKIPPTFAIDSITADKCNTTGKLTLIGSFSDDIDEEMKFDLPLTYPSAEIKCEFDEANANEKMEIVCKVQTEFKSVEKFIIEPRLIKKKNQEMFFIQGNELDLGGKTTCENYNTLKLQVAKQRQNSKFSFLQLGKLSPIPNLVKFFFALTRKEKTDSFQKVHTLSIKLRISNRRRLRGLDEVKSGLSVNCNLNSSLETDLAGGYDCTNNEIKGTPVSMELETDEISDISGIPENANPEKLTSSVDYSNIANLKKIDSLQSVNIDSIDGDTCSTDGQYIIYGTLNSQGDLQSTYSDVEIRFSSPESSGLCYIQIDNVNITMTCQNKEKFTISQILIDRQIVQDSEGNEIFIINSFTSPEQFACDISLNSVTINLTNINSTEPDDTTEPNETSEVSETSEPTKKNRNSIFFRNNNNKLSGGAIAAIVICSIIVVAGVGIIIFLNKRKILTKKGGNNIQECDTTAEALEFSNNQKKP